MDDAGPSEQARALAERFGARYEPHARPLGLNVARNTGVERSTGELVVFVDDDVEVCDGWLDALLAAARQHPEVEVFTGPILPRLEGSPPHSCGREEPPITALDLGPKDTPTRFAWGANMAIRRARLERVGPFDVSLEHGGDEQEWQERLQPRRLRATVQEAAAACSSPPGAATNRLPATPARTFCMWRAPRSTTGAAPPTRACVRCAAPPSRAARPPGASTPGAVPRRRSGASSRRSRAASAMSCAAAALPA